MCWVFALATGCYLRVMKMAYECDPSGLRARSRNSKESGTQGFVPAGRDLFGGFDLSLSHTSGSTMCYNSISIVLHKNGGAVRLREVSGEA